MQSNQPLVVTGYEIMEYIIDNRLIRVIVFTQPHNFAHTCTENIATSPKRKTPPIDTDSYKANQEQGTHTADIHPFPTISF